MHLVAIETDDLESRKDQAENNAYRTAAYTRGTKVGDALLLEGALALMSKHPLVIKFKTHASDEFISSIVFDTFEHRDIAERVMAVRNEVMLTNPPRIPFPIPQSGTASLEQLERLAALLQQGHLTEEEFAIQKQRVLAG